MRNAKNSFSPAVPGLLVASALLLGIFQPAAVAQRRPVETGKKPQTLLFVRTTPSGAEIRLDGKTLGTSDGLFPVDPGDYKIVVDLEGHQPHAQNITVRDGRITRIELTLKQADSDRQSVKKTDAGGEGGQAKRGEVPEIVATSPGAGAIEVDPATSEITVTFDRDMGEGFSWTGGGPDYPPPPKGKSVWWRDRRTCVLPVKLEPARYYRVGINSTSYQNFRSAEGVPARPAAIYFATRGASDEVKARVLKPQIVSMNPPNGAGDVDPALQELRITFSVPMGGGFSWTGGGPQFPEIPDGKRPFWTEDRKSCVLPVRLKPGWNYRLGLNSPSHKNFQSEGGIPLAPVQYTFSTRAQ